MPTRKVDLRSVFMPSDSIAFVVIIIGLFIALFLDEMAVRLIGVCIAVLGGVALFMMVSPRLTDLSMPRPPRPTESPLFMSQTTSDGRQTRQVFDSLAYRATFGAEDTSGEPPLDERQIQLFPGLMEERDPPPTRLQQPTGKDLLDMEFADGQSSVRVVRVRSSPASTNPPRLAIVSRSVRKATTGQEETASADDASPKPPTSSPNVVISGPVNSEVRLSDDVTVRPRGVQKNQPETPQPTQTTVDASADQPLRKPEIRVSAFMTDDDEEMEISEEPRKEFDYLLNRVLMVIRSATNARTAAFFWFNRERQQLVVEARITDATEQFTEQRKLPIAQDVVSQIALEGRPEIISDIIPTAELELIPYYTHRAGTVSFVGVPVYFRGNVVGVLCADSTEEHAYTDVTVGFFGHFTKLISGLVLSYTSKFDLQQNSRLLETILHFRTSVAEADPSVSIVITALFDAIVKHMDVSTMGVCSFDKAARAWTLTDARSVVPEYGALVGTSVNLEQSLVGECIRNGESIAISVEGSAIRVSPLEPPIDLCQFVAVPMRSLLHTHGALFLENHRGTITSHDVSVAEVLADLAGEMIGGLRDVPPDGKHQETDFTAAPLPTAPQDGFMDRLAEECARAIDYQSTLTACIIRIDPLKGIPEADESQVLDAAAHHIIGRVREQVREYDLVERTDEHSITVVLVAYTAQEAQFWTENLRRDVASSAVTAGSRRVNVTVSIGVAEFTPTDTRESLLDHAQTALAISVRQQNKVTVYS